MRDEERVPRRRRAIRPSPTTMRDEERVPRRRRAIRAQRTAGAAIAGL